LLLLPVPVARVHRFQVQVKGKLAAEATNKTSECMFSRSMDHDSRKVQVKKQSILRCNSSDNRSDFELEKQQQKESADFSLTLAPMEVQHH